jgi:beta-xylosidase
MNPVRRMTVAAVLASAALVGGLGGLPLIPAGASPPGVAINVNNAGAAGGPINENLLGLNHLSAQAAPSLKQLHVSWSRIDVNFEGSDSNGPVYNCTTGAFDPTALDGRVAAARAAGATPEVLLDYTPACLAGNVAPGTNSSHNPPDIGTNQAKWDQLVEEMAVHEIEAEHVTTFEVWNEPNGTFWNGTPAQYYALYVDTANALEAAAQQAHRTIEVGGPALATFTSSPDMTWMDNFLAYVNQHHAPLDFLSWHEYFNSPDTGPLSIAPNGFCFAVLQPDLECDNPDLTPADLTSMINDMRQALAQYPDLHPKLWLDEWNINAGFDPRMDGTYGAAFVAAVLATAQSDGLDRSDFYDAMDDSPIDNFGLLNQAGVPKPDFWTFDFWYRLGGQALPLTVNPQLDTQPGSDEVGAVASRSDDGTVQVLVYNFAPTGPVGTPGQTFADLNRQVTLTIDEPSAGQYTITARTIDTNQSGTPKSLGQVRGKHAVINLTAPGQSVELVSISRGAS